MKKLLLLALFVAPALSYTANAQRFEKLGQRKVNFKSDKDQIIGIGDGFFNALRIKVSGGSVNMKKMVIHFRNGQEQEVELNLAILHELNYLTFRDLLKPKLIIMKKLLLLALFVAPILSYTVNAQRFEKLGEKKVNFKSDKDQISGWKDGIYKSLRIKVTGGTVNMQKMVVHFRNGEEQEFPLKQTFADGDESRVIDLPGKRRFIDKVVFWYEATASSEGNKPVVELWGKHW